MSRKQETKRVGKVSMHKAEGLRQDMGADVHESDWSG
jgi:hypothetical protein